MKEDVIDEGISQVYKPSFSVFCTIVSHVSPLSVVYDKVTPETAPVPDVDQERGRRYPETRFSYEERSFRSIS
jgi:hypothetical protein